MQTRAAILLVTLLSTTVFYGQQTAAGGGSSDTNVKAFGAKGDNRSDDTQAIQSAVRATWGKGQKGNVYLPRGSYRITATIDMHDPDAAKPTDGACLIGDGMEQTIIVWHGPANQPAVRMMGAFQCVRDLTVVAESDWMAGISYDGDPKIGRSTHGTIDRVHVSCSRHNGDGIDLGKSDFQADMLTIYHPYINYCTQGNGIATWNGNVLGITVLGPTVGHNHIGILKGVTTNLSVFGGEFDKNDINFVAEGGGPLNITGVRSEESKRTYFDGVGGAPEPVTFTSYFLSSINLVRPQAKVTIAAQSRDLTLSEGGFVEGDWINIPGAGAGGKALRAKITEWVSPTHVRIQPPAAANVDGAALALDGAQYNFEENSMGPYVHIGMLVQGKGSVVTPNARGAQVFIGNAFGEDIQNPFGLAAGIGMPPQATIQSNLQNAHQRGQPMANSNVH